MPAKPELAKLDPYLIDDENPEATAEDFRRTRPASEVLPPDLYKKLVGRYEARRAAWESLTLLFDPEVAATLRQPRLGPRRSDAAGGVGVVTKS